jgi:phospholipase C
MRFSAAFLCLLQITILGAHAQAPVQNPFKHIVIVFQENRTPDNLFQGLCVPPFGSTNSCSTSPNAKQYDISTSNWLNKKSPSGFTQPTAVQLGVNYDMFHNHESFLAMCDIGPTGACKMDGAAGIVCAGNPTCPPTPQFGYVDNSTGTVNPYLELATQYGWANYMFQTNQGPSYPAHLFIFGGTSAPSASDDAGAVFISENSYAPNGSNYKANSDIGCLAPSTEWNWLISPQSAPKETQLLNTTLGALCFSHPTMASLVDQTTKTWKYYAPISTNPGGANPGGSMWNAPNSIQEICQPDSGFQNCTGTEWKNNVDLNPADVLTDISNCNLASLSWVIPTGQNSDHAGDPGATGGPSWVASVVNAIGNDTTCEAGKGYWSDTAIIITWDDWGGWYDHEPPTIISGMQGDYQYGFRVPLIVVSAFTPQAYISNVRYDFGSILRLIERGLALPGGEGALGFADARATTDLVSFFNSKQPPRKFKTIDAPLKADFFLHDTRPPEPPDND